VNVEKAAENVIHVIVTGNESLSFFYNVDTDAITTTSNESVAQVKVSQEAYERLLGGQSTFEREVDVDQLKIAGQTKVLRDLGREEKSKD
jgi:hypothetical protein